MKVTIKYFALFKTVTGKDEEVFETEASSLDKLYDELNAIYNFPIDKSLLKVALNDNFSDFRTIFRSSDVVAFIAPVSGG